MRNSVKLVIDAYDGSLTAYVERAGRSADPDLGADLPRHLRCRWTACRPDLRAHIRYPDEIYRIQTSLYTTYHMDAPDDFYHREDQWQIPAVAESTGAVPFMRHIVMRLPEESKAEFIYMVPFTPRGKDNLAAWMVARNDGDGYGKLRVYRLSRQSLVYGPQQIENRINQDTEISRQISLWDQRGSEVIRGDLLVIPIEESLLYVQPLYLQAEGGRIPELKRVVVAYQNQVVMEETLDGGADRAVRRLASGRRHQPAPAPCGRGGGAGADTGFRALTAEARRAYEAALEAQRSIDWARYARNSGGWARCSRSSAARNRSGARRAITSRRNQPPLTRNPPMKTLLGTIALALCCPILTAAAQDSASRLDALRANEKRAERNLVAAAEDTPADKYGFKPTPAQLSFGEVLVHLPGGTTLLLDHQRDAGAQARQGCRHRTEAKAASIA